MTFLDKLAAFGKHFLARGRRPVAGVPGREALVRVLAKADGLDWDERCAYEAGEVDCDSSTCVAAHYEDHDPSFARRNYYRRADAVRNIMLARKAAGAA